MFSESVGNEVQTESITFIAVIINKVDSIPVYIIAYTDLLNLPLFNYITQITEK